MNIIDRYIGRQIIIAILIVMLALLGVDLFFYLVNELRYVGKGDYHFTTALMFITLTIPRKIYVIFPWAALLGALLALGNLAKNSELVAMRAAMISVPRIAWSALKAAFWLTIVMVLLGEVISPTTEVWAQRKKTAALSRGQAIQTQYGTWVRHGNEFIHVGIVKQPEELQGVTRYSFDQKMRLESVMQAASANKNGSEWNLTDINGTHFDPNGLQTIQADQTQITELLDPEILQASTVKHLERLTVFKLWRVIKSRLAQELNATEYERAFWLKIVQPFAALVMVFLAVPFAFGPLRSSSLGLKILVGVLVGFSFHTLNSIFGPLTAVINLSPMLAAMLPTAMFLVLAYWMVTRVR